MRTDFAYRASTLASAKRSFELLRYVHSVFLFFLISLLVFFSFCSRRMSVWENAFALRKYLIYSNACACAER